MGAYNEVRVHLSCPRCKKEVETIAQFKYGSVIHDQYGLGDSLRWGANDIGRPGRRLVVVDGEGTQCPNCGYNGDWPVNVMIEHDVVRSASTAKGEYDFVSAGDSFIVLQE